MKWLFLSFLISSFCFARTDEVYKFNKTLMEEMKSDLKKDNVEDLKVKGRALRAPASVEEVSPEVPEKKTDKLKQLGPSKW